MLKGSVKRREDKEIYLTLGNQIKGKVYVDEAHLRMYATDASAYRELPLAVVLPECDEDIKKVIDFARTQGTGIIPRAAGTSLAGQVVGKGIVVDISNMNKILEVNREERWVRVQPGVVLDELNLFLKPYGLFFGPETSTSNRCMIGGMLGNNACGAHSLIYGSTRDHTLEVKGFLSDGNFVHFKSLGKEEFHEKCKANTPEGNLYRHVFQRLSDPQVQEEIEREYPLKEIKRRNSGYALDLLLDTEVFGKSNHPFNFCKLIAGSEGTLCFATEIKLNLVPLPPKEKGLVCVHFRTLEEALYGNLVALKYQPGAIELIDDIILSCTKNNIEQRKNRFFIEGDPGAIIVVEFARDTREEILRLKEAMEKEMREKKLGYAYPVVFGPDINKVWALRKAALGLLQNLKGDAKAVSVIEDTSVRPEDMPAYIADFKKILDKYHLQCVFHAHIATGELHLRPVLNLKDPEHVKIFRMLAVDVAHLVKKYRGSMSGEHGDGRLRGEFIPVIIGQKNYELCREIKKTWDPFNIMNPGKITDTPPMDASLRYVPGQVTREIDTYFDFSDSYGILRHIEQCNGSADCRKSALMGGTMCPSYMATHDEKCTTRARANILREYLTHSPKENPFDHREIYDILDLCLACKGCKAECPSNVDMAKIKSEFLQHWYDAHGASLRSYLIANITAFNRLGMIMPGVFNFFVTNPITSSLIKAMTGFAQQRSIPTLCQTTFRSWASKNLYSLNQSIQNHKGKVYLFVDEFTDYNDVIIGMTAVYLLTRLGYRVEIPPHDLSARTYISKGFLRKAGKIAENNVKSLHKMISEETPLVGIEPSAILGFRDEYPDLLRGDMQEKARQLAKNALLFEEFIVRETEKGNITPDMFTTEHKLVKVHGHCQQKAIASTAPLKKMLSLPVHYKVEEIPSGCCGMAGSFGYEKEHYELSMKVGELVLFPAVRNAPADAIICAPGTSCRHHIKDGTGRKAIHPVQVLFEALIK